MCLEKASSLVCPLHLSFKMGCGCDGWHSSGSVVHETMMKEEDGASTCVTGTINVSLSRGFVGIGPVLDGHPWTSGSGKKSAFLRFSWVTLCMAVVHR